LTEARSRLELAGNARDLIEEQYRRQIDALEETNRERGTEVRELTQELRRLEQAKGTDDVATALQNELQTERVRSAGLETERDQLRERREELLREVERMRQEAQERQQQNAPLQQRANAFTREDVDRFLEDQKDRFERDIKGYKEKIEELKVNPPIDRYNAIRQEGYDKAEREAAKRFTDLTFTRNQELQRYDELRGGNKFPNIKDLGIHL